MRSLQHQQVFRARAPMGSGTPSCSSALPPRRPVVAALAAASGLEAVFSEAGPLAAAPVAVPSSSSSSSGEGVKNAGAVVVVSELELRRRRRVVAEIVESARRKRLETDGIEPGCQQLESLLPGFCITLDALKAADWVKIVNDIASTSVKIVVLKSNFPGMNVARVLNKKPRLLLLSVEQLQKDATQVKRLLATAKNMDALLEAVPELLTPKILASVLVTVRKWWQLKKDPIEVLEADPDLIRRAQENDVPFDPVYEDKDGNFEAPLLNYIEKRTDWQAYLDKVQDGKR